MLGVGREAGGGRRRGGDVEGLAAGDDTRRLKGDVGLVFSAAGAMGGCGRFAADPATALTADAE